MKAREMFSFLPLINNSVSTGLCFLLLSILCILLSELYSSIFNKHHPYYSSIQLKLLNDHNALSLYFGVCCLLINIWYFAWCGTFAYRYILSVSGWWFIKLSNEFVFLDQELTIINNLYEWSENDMRLIRIFFFYDLSYNIIKVNYI